MSYDIYFIRRDPGQSFEDALDRTEASYAGGDPGPLTSVEIEQWERILPHARAILGNIEEFAGEATRELSQPSTGVQLTIFPGEVSITVPYWHSDDDAVTVMEKVYALAHAVETETGLEGYDPQLGEPIRDASPRSARASLRHTSLRLESGNFTSGAKLDASEFEGEQQAVLPPRHRPRWWEFWR